jgi:antitoxin (DNA-binding transcriptional repressor) of toxin-antitoxin stability system
VSVATLQQIGQDFPAWVALAEKGETVSITKAGREVARLVPPEDLATSVTPPENPPVWPDFASRQRAIFGSRLVFSTAEESASFWDDMRADRV